MKTKNLKQPTHRREFLGTLAAGAATLGLAAVSSPFKSEAMPGTDTPSEPDAWFKRITGKHKVVHDTPHPHDIFPFAWPRVFLMTNSRTGTPETDCSVVVVLRHSAIGYAFESRLWEAYKFGEMFKADDPATKLPALRNPFQKPQPGEFKVPGIGEVAIGINQLQESGVMFCVCDMAMTVYSAVTAEAMKKDAAAVKTDWAGGLLPGIQIVPSGVWALGRAQEHGCAYIFAG